MVWLKATVVYQPVIQKEVYEGTIEPSTSGASFKSDFVCGTWVYRWVMTHVLSNVVQLLHVHTYF